ncbi:MAG: hypothetical protein WC979_00380 [Candidatus Pacearchaeota archaeon]|jgi:hypothetical protein|nr:hypothetical protein [Clostridia bacterium]
MGMDIDYLAGKRAVEEIEELLSDKPHGEREEIADDIIAFAKSLKKKYSTIKKKRHA